MLLGILLREKSLKLMKGKIIVKIKYGFFNKNENMKVILIKLVLCKSNK
jgi:hypothetical protein